MRGANLLVESGGIGGHLEPIGVIADQHGGAHAGRDRADPRRQRRRLAAVQHIHRQRQPMPRIDANPDRQPLALALDAGQVGTQRGDQQLTDRHTDCLAPQARHLLARGLDGIVGRALTQRIPQCLEDQRHGAVAEPESVEHHRHPPQPGRGVGGADAGRVDPKGVAAPHTAVAPGGRLLQLGVAQGLGHDLVELDVLAPTPRAGTASRRGKGLRLDRGEDALQAHGSTPQ